MTKQELQDKIYKAGFEPPLWTDGTELYSNGTIIPTGNMDYELDQPHYTCEWLWQKLNANPLAMRVQLEYTGSEMWLGLDITENCAHGAMTRFSNLHRALLELFVWCIDNGYVINDKQ